MNVGPKILFFDIESAGVNALKSDLGFVILFGYKWGYEKSAHVLKIEKAQLRNFDDRLLLVEASSLLEQADLTVTHFGTVFDRRFIQGRLLINGLPPIPFTRMRDTCMITRSIANYSSNRLKHLAKILNLKHQKLENDWPTAWFKVMQGDTRALDRLGVYCKGDVLALEELYLRLQAFDNAHPRMFPINGCRVCGSFDLGYRGVSYVGERKYRRYRCNTCHKWDRERKAITWN